MNYEEFKQRTTEKATYETFQKFEKMYMAGDVDKDIFCRLMKPLVVAITEAAPFREAQDKAHPTTTRPSPTRISSWRNAVSMTSLQRWKQRHWQDATTSPIRKRSMPSSRN
ncbi:MAG: hypothetical protein IKR81_01490 [Victivallales bacterium]|nr:hypothetical protein [Victivallales bacterium]